MNRRNLLKTLGIASAILIVNPTNLLAQPKDEGFKAPNIKIFDDEFLKKHLSEKGYAFVKTPICSTNVEGINVRYLRKIVSPEMFRSGQKQFLKQIDRMINDDIFGYGVLCPPMYYLNKATGKIEMFFYAPVVKVDDLSYGEINSLSAEELSKRLKIYH